MFNCHLSFQSGIRPTLEEPRPGGNKPKKDLTGKRVAILVEEGFEQVELLKPRKALDKAGAQTQVVSPQESEVRGWNIGSMKKSSTTWE